MKLVIKNKIPELNRVREMIDRIGIQAQLDEMEITRLNLVMEEAVSNVILYAFPKGEDYDIEITAEFKLNEPSSGHSVLTFTIADSGMEFDPTARKDADITLPAQDRPIGGLGIYIVKQYMDTVSYRRAGGRNILTMTKTI